MAGLTGVGKRGEPEEGEKEGERGSMSIRSRQWAVLVCSIMFAGY